MSESRLIQFARDARKLVEANRYAVLSTLSVSQVGFPFGSVVPYDLDTKGRPIIFVAQLAEHFKNLSNNERASLTILDATSGGDLQAKSRATLLLNFKMVEKAERPALLKKYQERFPAGIEKSIEDTFVFLRGDIEKIRWIGGFGDIAWIDATSYSTIKQD